MDYYIFRHGITYFSKNDILYGDRVEDAPILPEAIPIIERLATYLKEIKTDFNVSSTYLRCRQTVGIVEKITDKKFVFDPLLRDIDTRVESTRDTADRINKFYEKLQKADNKSVVICSHGYPVAMLKDLITSGKINMDNIQNYPTTGVLLVIKNGKLEEVNFN